MNKLRIEITKNEYNTLMSALYKPSPHWPGVDDSIIIPYLKECRKLYDKLDKKYKEQYEQL